MLQSFPRLMFPPTGIDQIDMGTSKPNLGLS